MEVQILRHPDAVAERAADVIGAEARASVSARGRFIIALSGGRTPAAMLRALASREVPWSQTFVFQVDERVVSDGSPERNFSLLKHNLLEHVPLSKDQVYAIPVQEPNLEFAAELYGRDLARIAGVPPVLDCVHLGLGKDGHTASLVPGDPVLDVNESDVAVTGIYEGTRRLTLTFPMLNRARRIVWVITGSDKVDALAQLRAGDSAIPAGRINSDRMMILADTDAAGER